MYDLDFIFNQCGFNDLPEEIDRERLFNVSYDVESGEIKLYVLDKDERFAYKISRQKISRQFAGDYPQYGGIHSKLEDFFQTSFDDRQIVIDAVEGDNYYVYIEDAGYAQIALLLEAIGKKTGNSIKELIRVISFINNERYRSLQDVVSSHALSMIRVPMGAGDFKFYARPFLYNREFSMNDQTHHFIQQLHSCAADDVISKLKHGWVATDLDLKRTVIVSQYNKLLHID